MKSVLVIMSLLLSTSAFARSLPCLQEDRLTKERIELLDERVELMQARLDRGAITQELANYLVKEYTAEIQVLEARRLQLTTKMCN